MKDKMVVITITSEEQREYVSFKYTGKDYDDAFVKNKVYEGWLSGGNKGILIVKDERKIIISFGYKGVNWKKDKRFVDNFKLI